MAHFAKLDEDNVVLEVNVVNNSDCMDANGIEREEIGIAFLVQWSGGYPYWKQTSYNGNIRKNYAGIGFTYDSERDAFIPPKQYESWILDEQTCQWVPPFQPPQDGESYIWDEENQVWEQITENYPES